MSYGIISFDQSINDDACDEATRVAKRLGGLGHAFTADKFVNLVSKATSIDVAKRFEYSLGRVLMPTEEVRAIRFDLTQLSESEANDFMRDCGVSESEYAGFVAYLDVCAENDLIMEWYDDVDV